MKKRDNDRRYRNLLQKDYLKAIIVELSSRFDYIKNSWIAETIVKKFNETIENWEISQNIQRIKPGELLLPYKNNVIEIPLFDKKATDILVETQFFPPYRQRIIDNILKTLKKYNKNATHDDVHTLVYRREKVPRFEKATKFEKLEINPTFPMVNPSAIGVKISPLTCHICYPSDDIKKELEKFCTEDIGIKPLVANHILDAFLNIRARFLPLKSQLTSGQFIWIASSFKKAQKIGCLQFDKKQIPIVLTLYSEEEINTMPKTLNELNETMMRQLARITTEAYLQETLLPLDEIQLFYLRPYTLIGKLIHSYMKKHKVILPTPGSILDAGTMFTHKEMIINLSMQGYFTKEIAKKTCHDPRSVDSYLKTFNSILILWYYDLKEELISTVIERGIKVVNQHIAIIKKHFPDKEIMKKYLNQKGYNLN